MTNPEDAMSPQDGDVPAEMPARERSMAFHRQRMADFWRQAPMTARKHPLLATALLVVLLSAIYWLFIATPRYVSEAHVIVQKTDMSSGVPTDLASALIDGGAGDTGDQLLLRDYLLSVGMMQKLDREIGLREHWSQGWVDPITRLWFGRTDENLHEYYLDRISVEYDEYDGVIVITAEAFDPEFAHEITQRMVADGGKFMNQLAQNLALEQVAFLESQVQRLSDRAMETRQEVTRYQNRNGLVSPEQSAQAVSAIISRLEARRSELQIQLASMGAYLVDDHPSLIEIRQQIAAVDRQISQERSKLAGNSRGNRLNSQVEEFQRLQLQAEFAQNLYRNALTALEKGRIEGGRTIKAMSVIQPPTLPDSAIRPHRLYNTVLVALVMALVLGLLNLIIAVVRDHRD